MRPSLVLFFLALLSCGDPKPATPSRQAKPAPPKTLEAAPPLPTPADGITTVVVGERVKRAKVKRMGINLSEQQYYANGQIMKNLVRLNPGFEGYAYRSIIQVASTEEGQIVEKDKPGAWQDGFWDGAEYEIIDGKQRGKGGRIQRFERDENGSRYRIEGTQPEAEAYLVLRQSRTGDAAGNWWPELLAGGKLRTETSDLSPQSNGQQALRMEAPGRASAAVHCYFDSYKHGEGQPFLQLEGAYTLSFKAKTVAGEPNLQLSFKRLTQPNLVFLEKRIEPTNQWQTYQIPIQCSGDHRAATLDLKLAASGGTVLLDDVSLTEDADTNPTAFRGEVVEALRQLQPGILRYWAGQLGDSLENQLNRGAAQQRSGYSRWQDKPKIVGYSLPEFLELCDALDAEPWYVVPLTFSEGEMADLIEYLAGDATTKMGKRRVTHGQREPWTERFPTIHLEMGNEAWNGVFKGGNLEDGPAYGRHASHLIETAKKQRTYNKKLRLLIGGQAVWAGRNAMIARHATSYDALAVAPYLLHKLEAGNDPLEELFAEVDHLSRKGYMAENAALSEQLGKPLELAVYEVNLHTTQGSASEASLTRITASAAAGTAVAVHQLNLLDRYGIRDQCFYNLAQFDYKRGDKKRVPLWGAIQSWGAQGRKRPQYLALQLINEVLQGDLIESHIAGQKAAGRIQESLRTFAFTHDKGGALIIANLNPTESQSYRLSLPTKPAEIQQKTLSFETPTANNESRVEVTLKEQNPISYESTQIHNLPPATLTQWTWQNP